MDGASGFILFWLGGEMASLFVLALRVREARVGWRGRRREAAGRSCGARVGNQMAVDSMVARACEILGGKSFRITTNSHEMEKCTGRYFTNVSGSRLAYARGSDRCRNRFILGDGFSSSLTHSGESVTIDSPTAPFVRDVSSMENS